MARRAASTKTENLAPRSWFFRRPAALLTVGVTLCIVLLAIFRPLLTEFIEFKLYDLKFKLRGPRAPGGGVAIVAIDDASVRKVGRWPWSREVIAELLSRLKEAGPRVLALDIIFAERQETAGVAAVKRLRQELAQAGAASPTVKTVLDREERRADVDRQLAKVIAREPPTLLGFFFNGVGGQLRPAQASQFLGPAAIRASTYNVVRLLDQQAGRLILVAAEAAEVNLPEFTEAAAGGGYFNMVPDPDGTVRWLPLAITMGPDVFAPLSIVALQHHQGRLPLSITLSPAGVEEIRLGAREIPTDRFGRLLINHLGPPGLFPTYAAHQVMEGRLPPGALKDKAVLVGATAVGIYDLRVTPFSGITPGVEIQAAVMDSILQGDYLQTPLGGHLPVLLVVMGLGVLLGLTLPRLAAARAFVFALSLTLAYLGLNYLVFRYLGWQVEVFYPLLQIGGVYTGITVQRFLAEERERARLKKAFQSYVAPVVVEEIIRHPERLRLGGERRELTILFTDVRGFTTLSETLAPEDLVTVLHDFLNPMSEIIVEHGGTLDKYMGDAIMALFGAPLELPDHAPRACRTALKMVAALKALDREWEKQGRPRLRVGVGLNTGLVAVGNMGSDRLFDYTAIGDNVNLASRLEGLNKHYGTEILITEATARQLPDSFILREVDRVVVKGKKEPVAVYELLGEGVPDSDLARFLALYHQGLELFRARRYQESSGAFAAALAVRPEDIQAERYLELSEKFQKEPPDTDWQGVTVMDAK